MAHNYEIYGVVLASEFELKAPLVTDKSPDIHIKLANVESAPPSHLESVSAFASISNTQFWLDVPNIARFFVADLDTINVQPYPTADMDSVELYLLGAVLGPLMNMRKYLVMHGNVVHLEIHGQIHRLLLCGHSAVGKSSFSAYLINEYNARLVADDLAVFNSQGVVCSGSPRLKIWQDVSQALQLDEAELTPVRPSVSKFDWHIGERFISEQASVDLVVLLTGDNENTVEIEEIQGIKKLSPLQNQIFRKEFAKTAGLEKIHFILIGKSFGHTPVIKLGRPRSSKILENFEKMGKALFTYLTNEPLGATRDKS